MKIVVDAAGCDNPTALSAGIADAINQTGARIVAFGNKRLIEQALSEKQFDRAKLEIVNTEQTITNDDAPVRAVISKKQSSLVLAMHRTAFDDDCKAIISAGNTGAVLCAASIVLGRAEGVERPALATTLPNKKGGFVCIADCGANVDCRPEQLFNFAILAANHMRKLNGREPVVATLSVGTEDKKGNEQSKATFDLLKNSKLNFVGNIEAKSVLDGEVDVVVCDGFSGNVLLKSIEGTAKFVAEMYTKLLMKNLPQDADAGFVKKSLAQLTQSIDFTSAGGAFLLGTKKLVIKAHGAANEQTICGCVKQAIDAVK